MRGGEVIERARRWSGVGVDELSDRLDVSPQTVALWEQGDPEFGVVQRAVEACGLELHRVVAEPDPDPHDLALLDESLRLTVDQRLRRVINYARFVEAGRAALRDAQ